MTEILFVCRQNIGRSQAAMAMFNKYIIDSHADSAGTMVETEGQTLEDFGASKTIAVLAEEGIDATQFASHQLTESMLDRYDEVIVMAEPENIPDWLRESDKFVYWAVPDTKDTNLDETRGIYRALKAEILRVWGGDGNSRLEYVATSDNGVGVYIDHDNTHIALHVQEEPRLLEFIKEVVEDSELAGDKVAIEKDMGRIIGMTTAVKTTETDEIVYAKRQQRDTFTRFVKNREPQPTSILSIILFRADENDGTYRLWSAWCGELAPTSPGTSGEMPTSREFWASHALVYDEKIIDTSTVTTACPWDLQ